MQYPDLPDMTYGIGMSAPGNSFLSTGLGLLLLVVLCYVGGRIHQWTRTTLERDEAFREGYDMATRSLFGLATKTSKAITISRPSPSPDLFRGIASVTAINDAPSARHRAEDLNETTAQIVGGAVLCRSEPQSA